MILLLFRNFWEETTRIEEEGTCIRALRTEKDEIMIQLVLMINVIMLVSDFSEHITQMDQRI